MNTKLTLLIALTSMGCSGDPLRVSMTNNAQYSVGLLFENDGCRVYRFNDGGHKYYTDCRGETAWTESCGKACTRNMNNSTGN
jgi:hypothetical protein